MKVACAYWLTCGAYLLGFSWMQIKQTDTTLKLSLNYKVEQEQDGIPH